MGVFFCKKFTYPQRSVHYVQYQYFLFCILLIGGCVRTQRTPRCLRACSWNIWRELSVGGSSDTGSQCDYCDNLLLSRDKWAGPSGHLVASSWSATSTVPSLRCTACRSRSPRPVDPRPSTDATTSWVFDDPSHVLQSSANRSVTSCVPTVGELCVEQRAFRQVKKVKVANIRLPSVGFRS